MQLFFDAVVFIYGNAYSNQLSLKFSSSSCPGQSYAAWRDDAVTSAFQYRRPFTAGTHWELVIFGRA